ncbi:N-acetylmuramoyl-L-alanine amidase [Streptomyces sp. NPDC056568]|uniref:N-acetylmuramoyl-L-alanine amidase n=1 Tax=Streptomyces sp. NPDC056568 TaxID=3345866 RepID=UPI0036BE6680
MPSGLTAGHDSPGRRVTPEPSGGRAVRAGHGGRVPSGGRVVRLRRARTALSAVAAAAALALTGQATPATAAPPPSPPGASLGEAFARAAAAHDVPRDLLVAVGYGETRLDGHAGLPSQDNGYGVMHLVSNSERHTLERAARLTGTSVAELERDTGANIHGAAAVLRALADEAGLHAADRDRVDAWYPAVARYGAPGSKPTGRLYADAVYDFLGAGLHVRVAGGERVTVPPREVRPQRGPYAGTRPGASLGPAADYPSALWNPAYSGNYSAGRGSAVTTVVVHVTQGSYAGSISWFQNPDARVSAHYVVRSSDGQITQSVRESDTAWHARSANAYSVGVEHEGYVSDPAWFTDAMYRSSAALTRHLTAKYGIPRDRAHIVGHNEVPGNDHTDPGPHWDWAYYMSQVRGEEGTTGTPFPTWGTDVSVRQRPSQDSARVATLPRPTSVRVACQVHGAPVEYDGYSNDAWSYLPDHGGYVSNIFIDVPDAWLPGVPAC